MNVQSEKIELAKRLLETEDENLLLQIKEVFETYDQPIESELPEFVKAGIQRSLQQAEAGLLTPHEEVMKKYARYL